MVNEARLVAVTQPLQKTEDGSRALTAEELIVYCARVSNPNNQLNLDTAHRLIKYCVKKGHWSVFAQANVIIEIKTTRDISAQILRHKSMDFQEFSQRYSPISVEGLMDIDFRLQGESNRQVGESPLPPSLRGKVYSKLSSVFGVVTDFYDYLLDNGVARETARKVMPMNSPTVMYVNGTLRSWLHYAFLRRERETQKEHRIIAEQVIEILRECFPIIIQAYEDLEREKAFKNKLFGIWKKWSKKPESHSDLCDMEDLLNNYDIREME